MEQLVELVRRYSNNYDFPSNRIEISSKPSPLNFGNGFYGHFHNVPSPTSRDLDSHHHSLLWSDNPSENLAGLASVIYWGYATFSVGYAENRVRWLLNGGPKNSSVDAKQAQTQLLQCRQAIQERKFGVALSKLAPLGQLGRTPFASKVIAFMAPNDTGVYDNRIMDGLASDTLLSQKSESKGSPLYGCRRGVGAVDEPRYYQRYDRWCEALRNIASEVQKSTPSDNIRAVDVERAIFQSLA